MLPSLQPTPQPTYTCHACTISQTMKTTMARLLVAVLSRRNPFIHSVQTDWRIQAPVLPNGNSLQYFSRPGSSYRCHSPNTFRSGRAPPPKRERLGFPQNFRSARDRRTHRQKTRTAAPRPRSTPLTSPRNFVFRGHKSRGDPRYRTGLQSGQAIVREGAERPVC